MLQRARDAGVEAIVSLCVDFDKQKAALQSAALSEHPVILCAIGVHPNMVSSHRIGDKQLSAWLEEMAELARNPRAVAVDAGLDFSREYSTWYVCRRVRDCLHKGKESEQEKGDNREKERKENVCGLVWCF